MTATVFLFPGQGAQTVGMGRSLAEAYPTARAVFDEADRTLGFSVSRLCFEGPSDALMLTENTQPAILTVSVAAFRVLQEQGVRPDFVAGHSLGEYSGLVAAGSLSFADAIRIVRNRGRYMQNAVPAGIGAMAALIRLPAGVLKGILAEAAQGEVVTAANYNAPNQIVIAGHAGAVNRAAYLAGAAGATAVMLPVSAPFHCRLMTPAQHKLKWDLDAAVFRDLATPLVTNWQAAEIRNGEEARRSLFEQVPSPVRWEESMRYLLRQGVRRFIEVGPGKVLTGLLRSIAPDAEAAAFQAPRDLAAVTGRAVAA